MGSGVVAKSRSRPVHLAQGTWSALEGVVMIRQYCMGGVGVFFEANIICGNGTNCFCAIEARRPLLYCGGRGIGAGIRAIEFCPAFCEGRGGRLVRLS